jgi:hypothetical protein
MASGQSWSEEEELALTYLPARSPRRLPWCTSDEDYESVMADLAAESCRWS